MELKLVYDQIMIVTFLISWFVSNHYWTQYLTNKVSKMEIEQNPLYLMIQVAFTMLADIISCHKCLAFWLTLIITLNPIQAIVVSFTAFIFQKLISIL